MCKKKEWKQYFPAKAINTCPSNFSYADGVNGSRYISIRNTPYRIDNLPHIGYGKYYSVFKLQPAIHSESKEGSNEEWLIFFRNKNKKLNDEIFTTEIKCRQLFYQKTGRTFVYFNLEQDVHFFITPYIPGKTLPECIKQKLLQAEDLMPLFISLAEQLCRLECRGIVYNDLNANNVVYNPQEKSTTLIDGGALQEKGAKSLVKIQAEEKEEDFPHCSPSYLNGELCTTSNDIYSFGRLIKFVCEKYKSATFTQQLEKLALKCTNNNYHSFYHIINELHLIKHDRITISTHIIKLQSLILEYQPLLANSHTTRASFFNKSKLFSDKLEFLITLRSYLLTSSTNELNKHTFKGYCQKISTQFPLCYKGIISHRIKDLVDAICKELPSPKYGTAAGMARPSSFG